MEDKNKRTFKEMWNDKRMHAIIVLGMWFAFFALTFLILGVLSLFNSKDIEQKEKVEIPTETVSANVPKMLENLIASDYSYEYIIITGENRYSYNGTKEAEENKGYYESATGIIKYSVIDNVYYQMDGETLIENVNIISEQDKQFMDLNNIFERIKEYELNNEVIIEENKYIYDLLINENVCKIEIYTNNNNISEIFITYNDFNYDFNFKNIVN